jgi:predicted SAM-dependent methyltransferase
MASGTLLQRVFRHQTVDFISIDLRLLVNRSSRRRIDGTKPGARFLNLGAGKHGVRSADWLNVDGLDKRADVLWDVTRPLPFRDARFEGVFTEHLLEHLSAREAPKFLRECWRVLQPGAILRVVVPDGELYLRNYFQDRTWMLERRKGSFRTPMEVINEAARQTYEHQYLYDYETLALWLQEAGFSSVWQCEFRQGQGPSELLIDRSERVFESLYVEARR